MKSIKILVIAAIVAASGALGYSSYKRNQKPALSELAMANITALTQTGEGGGSSSSGYQVCSATRTTTTKKTNESGFSWELGVGWIFNGKISNKAPSTYYEVTETVTYKCCMNGGPETSCSYVFC